MPNPDDQALRDTIRELRERVEALESALEELFPGWRYGAHQPWCRCAVCE